MRFRVVSIQVDGTLCFLGCLGVPAALEQHASEPGVRATALRFTRKKSAEASGSAVVITFEQIDPCEPDDRRSVRRRELKRGFKIAARSPQLFSREIDRAKLGEHIH